LPRGAHLVDSLTVGAGDRVGMHSGLDGLAAHFDLRRQLSLGTRLLGPQLLVCLLPILPGLFRLAALLATIAAAAMPGLAVRAILRECG
jgi:hypothetical protein